MYVNGTTCPFPVPTPLATFDLPSVGLGGSKPDAVLGVTPEGDAVLMESGEGILGP